MPYLMALHLHLQEDKMGKSPRTVRLAASLLLTLGIMTAHSQSTGGKTNSAEGTLSVSAVVETSVSVQIEPDGSMKAIVANAPDPIGNFASFAASASLVPLPGQEKQPAGVRGIRRRPSDRPTGAGSNTGGDAFFIHAFIPGASSGTSSVRTAVFGTIPPNTLPMGENLATHHRGASPSSPVESRLVPGAPDQARARENFNSKGNVAAATLGTRSQNTRSEVSANAPGLRLDESVDKTTAPPGSNLTYTIAFTNESAGPLTNLKINNTTPPYTSFVSATCGQSLAPNLTDCAVTNPPPGREGPIQWTFTGTLSPAQTGTVSFTVKIE